MDVQNLMEALERQQGKVGFYFRNLVTGESAGYRAAEAFPAASVIKLPIFMYLCKLAAEGEISMDERIRVRQQDKVPICGALTLFTDEPECDLATLCNLMISLSDNTATNLLIRRLGIDAYRQGFREMGLKNTRLERLLFDEEGAGRGLENCVSPEDMALLLEKVYRREFVDEAVSRRIEDTLCLQQINHKICGIIGERLRVAHKTGEDDGLTSDVGLIYAEQPFILCCMGSETCVPQFEDFIRHAAADLCRQCGFTLD